MKYLRPEDIDDDLFMYKIHNNKIPTKWEQVAHFDEETGLAVVSINERYGAVDKTGQVIIPLIYHKASTQFSDGLLGVNNGVKWGYIDINNKVVIPFEYDSLVETWPGGIVNDFCKGTVSVKKNGAEFMINKANENITST